MGDIEEIKKELIEYNQEHIVKLLEILETKEKNQLIEQIKKIDFTQLYDLYNNTKKK